MSLAVQCAVNKVVTEVGIDCLGNEEKRLGATSTINVAPAKHRRTVAAAAPPPTGQACGEALTNKCSKAARALSRPQPKRDGIGKPTNTIKDLTVHHAGKIVSDVKDAVTCHCGPIPTSTPALAAKPTSTATAAPKVCWAPAENEGAFIAHLQTLFPGWYSGNTGFALGDFSMANRLVDSLIGHLRIEDSEMPFALPLAMAERLADITGGDIRHARQVLYYMQTQTRELEQLFSAQNLQPQDLLELLDVRLVPRATPEDEVRLPHDVQKALALQVAVSLSRHTHNFQALRKVLNPTLDLSPDDTRVYTKPSPHFLDHTNPACADGLLQQALQALDTLHTAREPEDCMFALRCLNLLCAARDRARMPAPAIGPHPLETFVDALSVNDKRDLFAWNQGMRSVDEMRGAGACMQKNCIWMDRTEAIQNDPVLRATPAPLRSLFWGKAPYQAAQMGDGGAASKHPDEMLEIYHDLRGTLLRRLHAHGAAHVDLATLRTALESADAEARPPLVKRSIEMLLWESATQYDETWLQDHPHHSLSDAIRAAFNPRLHAVGLRPEDVLDYLRDAGHNPETHDPTTQLIDHCLSEEAIAAKLDTHGLLEQAAVQHLGTASDVDPRTGNEILRAMELVRNMETSPEDLSIESISEFLQHIAYYGQDNSWRAEEKLSGGVNGVIFAGLAKFHSLGLRITGTGARSAFIGIDHKNWGTEFTCGNRTHRNTGTDVRYSGGSEDEFGENLRCSAVASIGYDAEYVDAESIKILVRRDYEENGNIKNATHAGQPVLGDNGKPVQAHREGTAQVIRFFTDAASSKAFAHVEGAARLAAYDPVEVFSSFANEFFLNNLVSVSQTHSTSSSQKVSAYAGVTARAAMERDDKKFQIGGTVTPLQASHTATKNATHDQNGSRALDMVSYTHSIDVRSAAGISSAVVPSLNPKTSLPTTANPIGAGITASYRAQETRGQMSILRQHGCVDAVFSYSGENYKRPKDMKAALHRDLNAWSGYFGGEEQLKAAVDKIVATCDGENEVLMIRRRLRAHVGPKLDMLEGLIKFHRDLMHNPHRSEAQRVRSAEQVAMLQSRVQEILSSADSFEPFGIGSFARVEKTRNRGISYYLHFVNSQSMSATHEKSYASRKPAERDRVRHLDERIQRDRKRFAPIMQTVANMVATHQQRMDHGYSLRKRKKTRTNAVDGPLQEREVVEPRAQKQRSAPARRSNVTAQSKRRPPLSPEAQATRNKRLQNNQDLRLGRLRSLDQAWHDLPQLRKNELTWRLKARQPAGATPEALASANAATAHADRLKYVAGAKEGLLRHLVHFETIREQQARSGWAAPVANASYALLQLLQQYEALLDAEATALSQAAAGDPHAARLETRRRREAQILKKMHALLAQVNTNERMRGSDAYGDAAARGWADLHKMSECWERLHAATRRECAQRAAQQPPIRQVHTTAANASTRKAGLRLYLGERRSSLQRLMDRVLADDKTLVRKNDREQLEQAAVTKRARVQRLHNGLVR